MSVLKIVHLNKSCGKLSPITRFRRNYANLETVDMAYTTYGKDSASNNQLPPLIVMHCLFGSKRTFHSVSDTLHKKTSPQLRLIAVDARNHGDSPHANNHSYPHLAEDVMAFIKKHDIKKSSLLGHSMGGRTAMYFALKYPNFTDKLIVADISPVPHLEKMEFLREIVETIKSVKLPQNMSLSKARDFVNSQLLEKIKSKSEREFILTNLTENVNNSFNWLINAASLAVNMNHIIGFPDVSNLKFDGPVLFLLGEKSDFVEKKDYPQILKLFPNAEFYVIPRAGHWLFNDNFGDFTQKCISFLNKSGVLKNSCRFINMAYTHFKVPSPLPPLIIMHGLLGSKKNWNQMGLLLHKKTNPRREVYLIDARNHGESPHIGTHTYSDMSGDIKTFLFRHNIDKAALLGHSMGGRAMMYFTLTNPDLVEKLIVGDISPGSNGADVNFTEDVLVALCKVVMPRNVPKPQAKGIIDIQLSKTISDLAFRKFLLNNLKAEGHGKYVWQANVTVLLENYQHELKNFPKLTSQYSGRTLFVSGSRSDYLRKRDHKLILELFPKAQFRKIEKAGHLIHFDNPRQFLQVCTDFLDK